MKELIVIKLGGVAATNLNQSALATIADWRQAGKRLIIVHGGGYVIDKLMVQRQLPIEKISGLRITPAQAMLCVAKGLSEMVGPKLTKTLNQAGLDALQINRGLGRIVKADYLDKATYGYVGKISSIEPHYLLKVIEDGLIPVLPSLGQTLDGHLLNINADDLASQLAIALQADQLILMTDVPGVKENGEVLPQITPSLADRKIAAGVILGNMIPKVRGAVQAIQAGVGSVCIGQELEGGTQVLNAI